MAFPVFCYGSYAQDQKGRGKVVDFRLPLEIEGVRVQPGDIVFGDVDGVVVLPRELEEIVVPQALALATKEKIAKKMLQEGASSESVFSETGVL
jgi:regulator of RNase E activity RraA